MKRYALKHTGKEGCGQPAFYLKGKPVYGTVLLTKDAILPDGSRPTPGTPITCGACGRVLRHLSSFDVEPVQ